MVEEKIKILFDATVISNALDNNANRSGIFFCAYNVLTEMLKREDISVTLYCDLNRYEQLKQILNIDEKLKSAKIIEQKNYFYNLASKLACKKANSKKGIKKAVIGLFLSIFKKLAKDTANYGNFTHYFSPLSKPVDKLSEFPDIKKYIILYDTIPLLFDKDKVKKYGWYTELIESINEKDNYFAISECTKKDFIRLVKNATEKNITVSYLGANDNFYPDKDEEKITYLKGKYQIPSDKKFVLCLCNLDPRKNQIFAIKNFLKFVQENKIEDLVFVLGGGKMGDFLKNLEADISELNVDYKKYIVMAGYIADEDLSCLYSHSEFFVYPSLYEGFGLPILEAMQCGCPVITSNCASIPEVAGDTAIMIDPKSDEQLINAYKSLYYNSELKKELSQKGLERAKQFSWSKTVDIIIDKMKEA